MSLKSPILNPLKMLALTLHIHCKMIITPHYEQYATKDASLLSDH